MTKKQFERAQKALMRELERGALSPNAYGEALARLAQDYNKAKG